MNAPLPATARWAEAIAGYQGYLASAHRPLGTLKLRSYHLRRFARSTGLGPFDATPEDLEQYLAAHKWSANTHRSVRCTLRSYFKWATRKGYVSQNPAIDLPGPTAQIGKPRPAPEQVVTSGLMAADQRVRLMVAFAAWLGLRCCEIAQLHSDDLMQTDDGWELRVVGKGDKIRHVPCPDRLAQALTSARGFLFPGDIDGHLSAAYVSKLISRALPSGWTAHTLRHRYASRAFLADHDLLAVKELLGHASVATTQIYTAIPRDGIRRAAAHAYSVDLRFAG